MVPLRRLIFALSAVLYAAPAWAGDAGGAFWRAEALEPFRAGSARLAIGVVPAGSVLDDTDWRDFGSRSTLGFRVSAGYFVADRWRVDVTVDGSRAWDRSDFDDAYLALGATVDLRWYGADGRFRDRPSAVYVGLHGGPVAGFPGPDEGKSVDFGFLAGPIGGVEHFLTDRVSVFSEGRYGFVRLGGRSLHVWGGILGIAVDF